MNKYHDLIKSEVAQAIRKKILLVIQDEIQAHGDDPANLAILTSGIYMAIKGLKDIDPNFIPILHGLIGEITPKE